MKTSIKTILLIGFFVTSSTKAQKVRTVTGFHHVESVATDGKYLYAADIGKELTPTAKDGDGQILKLDKKGAILEVSFVREKLNAPKGLAINKGVLYVNDIDRLLAFDLKSGSKLYEIDFSKDTAFLNDIAIWDNNTLYVSATDKNTLFKVNLADQSYAAIKTDTTILGINGLFCYKKSSRMYVNGLGADQKSDGIIGYINLKDNTFTRISNTEGLYDGIFISNDVLYVSNWVAFEKKGIIQGIGIYGAKRVTTINPSEPLAGPADFVIADGVLIVPAMLSGEIHFITLDSDLSLRL